MLRCRSGAGWCTRSTGRSGRVGVKQRDRARAPSGPSWRSTRCRPGTGASPARRARTNAVPASAAPSATAARIRRSVSDSPSRVDGYSRLSRSNASPRNRSSPERVAAMARRPSGVGRPEGGPRVGWRARSAAGVSRAHAFVAGSSRSCSAVSSPRPPKRAMPGCSPMQIRVMRSRRHAEVGQAGEDLDDLELVVQVRLEPQHVLAVAVGRQGPVPLGEHRRALARGRPRPPRRGRRL